MSTPDRTETPGRIGASARSHSLGGVTAARSSSPRRRSKGQSSTRLRNPRRPIYSCGDTSELTLNLSERLRPGMLTSLLLGRRNRGVELRELLLLLTIGDLA